MALAIFDLDNTLLGGDSDHSWGEFLVNKGVVDATEYKQANDRFYQHYLNGTLDIHEFLSFALRPLTQHSLEELAALHQEFMQRCIEPMMLPKAQALLQQHREAGDFLLIITATNRFVTEPIARRLGVDDLLATDPELLDGRYTGDISGTPCFQEGKVERLEQWLADKAYSLEGSYFYSDSCNDLPLLERVDNPVAVDADARLSAIAIERGWPLISLREAP
ncbi:HAD family hydrolase [Aestuariirhabdus litorea]|uniref:Histidinol-phosphatase n=1 Tax=Aestuariirhabdus litorea TaxID=2528527 RepID=A0A3P3VL80_9GAMM|nr:HAD family hydrolase [Aestuariirhabdus litorea]RRJ83087.1 HAD family hydrolase [Aestuariirhabdus litorea]RWW93244.1 HAD-IB family hydrolase [Endozoicomonadaceae bacterium GTF-13]